MIHSTKRDQYWSFWCWGWSDHLNQEVCWGNWAVEAVEASEVAEATKVNLVIWVPGMIQPSGSAKNLMKWGCRGHWGYWGCWGCWGHWGCRCSKDWKITTDDFRVIQVLEFSFILMFWKKMFGEIMKNIMLNLSIFSVGGCRGQPMSLFWIFFDETQMLNIGEHANHHECFLM